MNRFFILFFLMFHTYIYAAKQTMWNFQYGFNLKKDKIATLFINRQIKNRDGKSRYILKFRWTLYNSSGNLFLFVNYMGHSSQYILKKKRHLDRVRIKLLPDGKDYGGQTYAILAFTNFDEKKRVAAIEVYIKDEMQRVKVDFKEPKKE